jgi:hypothetical protein
MHSQERPLTDVERAAWLIDQVSPLKFVTVAHVAGDVNEAALRQALDAVQARHPLLRVGITPGSPPRYRHTTRPIELRIVPRADDETWRAEVDREREVPMDAAVGPLVRVVLVRSSERSEILATSHHVMSDGMTAIYFMRDLLDAAGRWLAGSDHRLASLPPRPGVDELLSREARGWQGLRRAIPYGLRQLLTLLRRPRKLAEERHVPLDRRRSRTRHVVFEAEFTAALQGRCRAERTTVHGALAAAALLSVYSHLQRGQDSRKAVLLGCCTPVNLRQELDPPLGDDEIGLFVGPVVSFHEVGGSLDFWALAREVRDAVHGARSDHGPATALVTQCLLLPRRATPRVVAKHLYHPLFGAIAVTNLGSPAIARHFGPLTLEQLHVNPTSNPFGSLLSLSVATVHGRMTVNFNYNEGVLGEATIDALVAGVCGRLQRGAEPLP